MTKEIPVLEVLGVIKMTLVLEVENVIERDTGAHGPEGDEGDTGPQGPSGTGDSTDLSTVLLFYGTQIIVSSVVGFWFTVIKHLY